MIDKDFELSIEDELNKLIDKQDQLSDGSLFNTFDGVRARIYKECEIDEEQFYPNGIKNIENE